LFGRALQQAPGEGVAPNLHAASHLVLLVMTTDAEALYHWNQQEWGQQGSSTTSAGVSSHACCPALWQA